ncbi:bifunctional helix-turn-helix domain-containing protein/methylated-DNA--[protein]-cysteine S-methyltransferase [Jiulongibacter sp. NS-SX5]|uniref:bifunctional helix-turn-helix domain-containing protein/methylated-DNA--[protein]-cysteine S-methyltransferase n=1 Tax=Jiulongibacter sp. NS-SX5 TaxID=3463854 RepID=UPI004059712C
MEQSFHYETIAKAIQYLRDHQTEQPTLDQVANHVNLSKFHLQRTFRKYVGVSPKDFLQFLTIEKAKKLLEKGQSTLSTSHEIGLSGNGRLHDLFLKIESCTPGEFRNRGRNIEVWVDSIDTPFGKAIIAETEKGISSIEFEGNQEGLFAKFEHANFKTGLGFNGQKVQEYFNTWQIPDQHIGLDLIGTPFQVQVWKALLKVPTSHLATYSDIASLIDNQGAVRAVGSAIGKNPIAYLIPCHRIIKSGGEFGNYKWSPIRKEIINGFEFANL